MPVRITILATFYLEFAISKFLVGALKNENPTRIGRKFKCPFYIQSAERRIDIRLSYRLADCQTSVCAI